VNPAVLFAGWEVKGEVPRSTNPDATCQPHLWVSSKTGNGSDIQGTFDQIVTKVNTQTSIPTLSLDGDLSCYFHHDDFFM
jgi:hypothetical protein